MDYILTNEGAALMTKAVTGKDLVFTRAESGDGYSSSPAVLSDVIGKHQELHMDVVHEGSDVKITCLLTNFQLEEGYTLKQLGVYAKLEEDAEDTLFIIGQQYSGEVIHPFSDGEAEYEFIILMKASGTSSITVEGGAGSLALKKDLDMHANRNDNPHNVTAKQLGLDKVANVRTSDQIPEFKEAENRANIESGNTLSILFGKIERYFTDLKSAAFASIANNCTTTEEGHVLDARQGTALQEQVDEINGNIDELKKSVADGKALIASAITRKGITTASDADFETIATNIARIVVTSDTVHSVYATCTYNGKATNQMVMTLYKDGQSLGSKNYTSSAYGTYYTNTYSV